MGSNNLSNRADGQVITESFFNDIHQAMNGDFVGRNSSGAPTSAQNLGTASVPWGVARLGSLILNGSSVDPSQITSPQNRIISGKTRTTSIKTDFIRASGAGLTATISATATNLVVDINGVSYTVATDIAMTSLTAAPSSNNTCLVNDTLMSSDYFAGETDAQIQSITIDTVGSEISALVGQWITLKTSTEYMFGYLESATKFTNVFRGFFIDSSGNPIHRVALSDNDTLTLMKTGWVFVDDDAATYSVSYTTPVWNFTAPSTPATNDYWYDMNGQTWKRYSGSAFEIIGRTLIGLVVMDSTNCVASRSLDAYFKPVKNEDTEVEVYSTEIVQVKNGINKISVWGYDYLFQFAKPNWNITTDRDTGVSESNSTLYYLYLKHNGDTVISDKKPHERFDLGGKFHPFESWLYIASAFNDASGNLTYVLNADYTNVHHVAVRTANGYGSTSTTIRRFTTTVANIGNAIRYADSSTLGGTFTIQRNGLYSISFRDALASAFWVGVSLNSTQLTTSIQSIAVADRLAVGIQSGSNSAITNSVTAFLKVGDVIRAHGEGAPAGANVEAYFTITKIG